MLPLCMWSMCMALLARPAAHAIGLVSCQWYFLNGPLENRSTGIAMPPAGLCLSPLSFDNGCMDRNADCCVNTIDEKIPVAKRLVNCGSRDDAIATNFVAQNRDKLAWNAFIVCAGILQRLGRSQNLYPYRDPGSTHYILYKFGEL